MAPGLGFGHPNSRSCIVTKLLMEDSTICRYGTTSAIHSKAVFGDWPMKVGSRMLVGPHAVFYLPTLMLGLP